MADIDSFDIKYLKGIGDKRGAVLAKELGGSSLRHLLYYFPFRHIDRSKFYKIRELREEYPYVQLRGRFISFAEEGVGAKRRLKGLFSDGERVMECTWFSKIDVIRKGLQAHVDYVIFGKPKCFNGSFSITHPEIELYDPERLPGGMQGVYTISDKMRRQGVSQRVFHKAMESLMEKDAFRNLKESLPPEIVESCRLMPLAQALRQMHCPTDADSVARARFRLKFEELFYLELNIIRFGRLRSYSLRGHVFASVGKYFNDFYARCIPFELTGAQKRVLREIRNDMRTGRQMNRLLQGDVGSGKTMVAFMTMLLAVDNGKQAAIIAPTEILASQHYDNIRSWCADLGLECRLLTGSTRTRERRETLEALAAGEINIVVGTHAILEEKVKFADLGVAVIDEQHRFGVAQRAKMWTKNSIPPHVLVMTATPIPRTLAMTVYGDLEVSVIDELPPGRKPVQTLLAYDERRMEINTLIGRELRAGRQVYIVYPLIHDNPRLTYKSVEQGYERIMSLFPDYKVSCVHGQLSPEKKDREMAEFVEGRAQIMVATTVIEVGVNVPNATVMVIENAERFGLAQLHQLRGRVGRGSDRSFCVLVGSSAMAPSTRRRLEIMTESTDGFFISEADMQFRGPGDIEGTQQSGLPFELKVASLTRDGQILKLARDTATSVLDAHPEFYDSSATPASGSGEGMKLSQQSLAIIASELKRLFSKKADWSRIS